MCYRYRCKFLGVFVVSLISRHVGLSRVRGCESKSRIDVSHSVCMFWQGCSGPRWCELLSRTVTFQIGWESYWCNKLTTCQLWIPNGTGCMACYGSLFGPLVQLSTRVRGIFTTLWSCFGCCECVTCRNLSSWQENNYASCPIHCPMIWQKLFCITFRRACICARWTLWHQNGTRMFMAKLWTLIKLYIISEGAIMFIMMSRFQLTSWGRYEILWVFIYDYQYEEVAATFFTKSALFIQDWEKIVCQRGPKWLMLVVYNMVNTGCGRPSLGQSWSQESKGFWMFLENQMAQSYRVDDVQPSYNWLRRSNAFISSLELAQVDAVIYTYALIIFA